MVDSPSRYLEVHRRGLPAEESPVVQYAYHHHADSTGVHNLSDFMHPPVSGVQSGVPGRAILHRQ